MANRGRPSKYDSKYDQMLIDHMAQGLSFESFAGLISVNKDTLSEWVKVHEAFSVAKKEGLDKNRLFWEKLAIDHILNKSDSEFQGSSSSRSLNATVWIFNMKNRFPQEWRDKRDIEVTENSTLAEKVNKARSKGKK
jgi:hypothetical protein